ncbi:TRAP transporter permease [Bacillus carboniphilus]|uniref:TRAP transporter permease n=1 Tax=Bacillus carboniphilus TaxID=86663 RepID=A0ABN0W5Y9_9BACI
MSTENKVNLEDFERGERELSSFYLKLAFILGGVLGLVHVFILSVYPIDPWVFRAIHFGSAGAFCFLLYPALKKNTDKNPSVFDLVMAVLLLGAAVYIALNYLEMLNRVGVSPTGLDLFFAIVAIVGLLEMTRRTTGIALPIIAVIFLLYAYFGSYFPNELWHRGYSIERILSYTFSMDGIFSIPLGVAATYVFVFILFGSFLEVSGAGKFFMDLSYAIAGRFRGGPAKVAVLSSALMGSINGSAVANVASTGAFTIPLMKKVGYKPKFAGAVEAVASTGGQILPPVMGAGAFIMADMTGIPYTSIVIAAIVPAFLYFFAVLCMVDFEAGKQKLEGLSKDELPNIKAVLKERGYLITPLIVLLFSLIVLNNSPIRAALLSIGVLIIMSWFTRNKIGPKQIWVSISNAMKGMASIAATCASAGIIIGVFALTGLGGILADFLIALSGGVVWIGLVLVMILCILLGMGLPTVAAYALAASTVAPALINMGVPQLSAHLFIFYFACISTITPPVALSSFAGAALAKARPMQVAWTALKLGITAFIVPYLFIIDNSLLLQGDIFVIIMDIFTASIGIVALAAGIQKFMFNKLTTLLQLLILFSAIMLVIPIIWISVPGLILFLIISYFNYKNKITHVEDVDKVFNT